jgi:hypothetical protein
MHGYCMYVCIHVYCMLFAHKEVQIEKKEGRNRGENQDHLRAALVEE